MKTIAIALGMILIAAPLFAADVERNVISVAEIHAGAAFGKSSDKVDIILIETYNGCFFLGNAWGNKYKLYSNWSKERGGTPEQVAAYLRGEDYRYIGKTK